jgi:asparagine synthase (glutamine-hydrolysing)
LSIVDRAGGHQPISNEKGDIWIAFNGEIYNHPELLPRLESMGHQYRTHCDTETVVHAYEQYGEEMVQHLRGMFGFAIWDARKRKLLIYRDRLGIKPMYYARTKSAQRNALVFGSEVKSLLECGVPFGVEHRVMESFLRRGYVSGELTMFKDVFKLLPGSYLIADADTGAVQVKKYWEPRFSSERRLGDEEYERAFLALFEETLTQHRLGEVPQGTFLSGGVDSSAVIAVSAAQVTEQLKTFSIGYSDDASMNELPAAKEMAQRSHTDHHEFLLSGENFATSLPDLVWKMDEPVADPAAIPLFFLSKLAREQITVVHSGEGADEALAGYGLYKKMLAIGRGQKWFGHGLASSLAKRGMVAGKVQKYLEWGSKPLAERYRGIRSVMTEHEVATIYKHADAANPDSYGEQVWSALFAKTAGYSDLNRMLYVDQQTWLPDDLLIKADRMTMAASIELRVPFLDHKMLEFCATLPDDLKLRKSTSKYLLKKIMRGRVPDSILDGAKKGFSIPIGNWLKTSLHETTRGWILDSPFLSENLRRPALEEMLKAHKSGSRNVEGPLFALICLSLWHQTFSTVAQRHRMPTLQNQI